MTGIEFGILMMVLLLVIIAFGMPVGIAMLLIGGLGFAYLSSFGAVLSFLESGPFSQVATHSLTVVPLFVLMGEFAARAGLNTVAFRAANAWLGHIRGGLATATIGSCAGFGAICGSSIATGATMSKVCLPEMERYKYSGALATGSLAAGSSLGILIPPSVILVIYAILVEESIAALFLAAFIPGIMAAVFYMIAIAIYARLVPSAGPPGDKASWATRFSTTLRTWPIVIIFTVAIGGIYVGIFTPTEGAAVGAVSTGALAFLQGKLDWREFREAILGAGQTTAMVFLILIGAELYSAFLARTGLPFEAAELIAGADFAPVVVILLMLAVYLVMGCVMDSLAMILLTVPVFHPIVIGLDLGLTPADASIWFGIIILIVVEVALITPPFGLNVFIINGMSKNVPLLETFKGVMPFIAADAVRIALLVAFPAIALWLTWI